MLTLLAPLLLPPADPAAVAFFRDRVEPILVRRCLECHGSEQRGGLDLRSRAFLHAADPVVVPGRPDESRLVELTGNGVMPPKKLLPKDERAVLRAWVARGAYFPQQELDPYAYSTAKRAGYDWWSLQPIRRPAVPTAGEWGRTPIDGFILERLQRAGLAPSPPAERTTLLRRVSLDLTGLPPTWDEVRAFREDRRPDAYERAVERLLASPAYGERWGRHWLDVVRFAETHGFEMNQPRPNAWRYRDWVIAAFNSDLPYPEFITAQLAGDAAGADAATGFLVAGPWDQVKSPDPGLTAQQRMDELHDMVSVTGATFLGLTVGCGRCHDHKFDPFPQRDYYRLQAVFAGVQHGDRPLPPAAEQVRQADQWRAAAAHLETALDAAEPPAHPATAGPPSRPAVRFTRNVERFAPVRAQALRFTVLATGDGTEPCLDELEVWSAEPASRNVAGPACGTTLRASSVYPNSPLHRLEHLTDGRVGNSRSWISAERGAGWVELTFARPVAIDRVVWGRDRLGQFRDRLPTRYRVEVQHATGTWETVADHGDRVPFGRPAPLPDWGRTVLEAWRDGVQNRLQSLAGERQAYAGTFANPGPTYRLHRGEALQPREPVTAGSPSKIGRPFALPADAPERDRRLALARWIADPANPLPARVMVNRVWHYHFGRGLVDTPSDFGMGGGRPSHPELLDWLAAEFVERGWSLKRLHRLIVLSATYRQASSAELSNAERGTRSAEGPEQATSEAPRSALRAPRSVDADARLLWRFPPRRLEAEALRDAILTVSGALDRRMGGPGYSPFEPNTNYVRVYQPRERFGPDDWRRMVYQQNVRMELCGTFGAFDCPDGGQAAPQRNRSTTPIQALHLLNGPFLQEQAERVARRLEREAGADPEAQAVHGFRLAFQRDPDGAERAAAAEVVRRFGAAALGRALFNASELLYLE